MILVRTKLILYILFINSITCFFCNAIMRKYQDLNINIKIFNFNRDNNSKKKNNMIGT